VEGLSDSATTQNKPSISLGASSLPGGGRMGAPGEGRMGGIGGQDSGSRATMLEELKKLSTGEEKIMIPVGIQMLKAEVNTETKKREMVEATLSDINADKMITVWLNAAVTDKKVAEFILIN
jgi:hypothetical protein